MYDEDVELQNLGDYFEDYVISQLLESICREAMEDFRQDPEKTYIQAISIMCNVPVKNVDPRLTAVCFFRARKPKNFHNKMVELSVDFIHLTDEIPDELLDAYNLCHKKNSGIKEGNGNQC